MAQFARPDSTVSAGGWTAVGAATLHAATDEVTPNGATDYAEANSGDTTMELGLSDVNDPGSSTGHTIRVTALAVGSGQPERLDISLYQGGTLIVGAFSGQNIDRSAYTAYTYTLSALEADSITDYTNLRFRIAVATIGGGTERLRVTQAELEVPDASIQINGATGSVGATGNAGIMGLGVTVPTEV